MQLISGLIAARREAGLGWLIFDNPAKLNALSPPMMQDALQVVESFAADADVHVVIMRGAGEKAFISGGDISSFETTRGDAQAEKRYRELPDRLTAAMAALGKPLIAMIHGYCLGGGMSLALCADLRFAATSARLGVPAARRGIVYPAAGLARLSAVVGPSVAKDLMFSARQVPAEEALRLGLVNRVFEPHALESETIAYARLVAENAPLSVRAAKFFIDQVGLERADRDEARMAAMAAQAADSEDFREATRAFLEKRKPVFRGV